MLNEMWEWFETNHTILTEHSKWVFGAMVVPIIAALRWGLEHAFKPFEHDKLKGEDYADEP